MQLLDYRYLYVFKVKGKNLYKIGISKDWNVRKKQIQKSKKLRGKLRLMIAVPLVGATFFEQRLHKKFDTHRKPIKGVSGGTEFFELNNYDGRIGLRGEVLKYFIVQLFILTVCIMTVILNILGWTWRDYLESVFN
ncbi:MAG: GIY-YIG nuclease family protein [Bacteroidota bacterium]